MGVEGELMRAGDKRKPGRMVVLFAVGLAVLAAVVVALAPMGRSVTTTMDSSGASTTSRETYSLLESEGTGILVVASVPVVIALVPLLIGRFGRGRAFTVALVIATTLMGLFVLLTGFSIGLLYAPAFVALLVATVQAKTAPAAAAE